MFTTDYLMYPLADIFQMDFAMNYSAGTFTGNSRKSNRNHPINSQNFIPLLNEIKASFVSFEEGTASLFMRVVGDLYVRAWCRVTSKPKKKRSREIVVEIVDGAELVLLQRNPAGVKPMDMKFPDGAIKARYLFSETRNQWERIIDARPVE